jgi:mRNA interferase RelE/StbE
MTATSLPYRIELSPSAARALRKLAPEARRRIARKIDTLAEDPRPADTVKLEGESELYRVRVGDYRIVYTVRDAVLLVLIVAIGNRADIYKLLRRR